MRITGGHWKGRQINAPKGTRVRPTSAKVREAIFSILTRSSVVDTHVVDLYCGAGTLGLEALSREAADVLFVDGDKRNLVWVRRNLKTLQGEKEGRILHRRLPDGIDRSVGGSFDLVFSDPPYNCDVMRTIGERLIASDILSAQALWIHELSSKNAEPNELDGWELLKIRRYGDTMICVSKRVV